MTACLPTTAPPAPGERASRPGAPVAALGWLAAWWPLLLLAGLAFAARWPNLWYIPQFTDEVLDAQHSYSILAGKRPLIGTNAYTGAFHYYLEAGLHWLFGPSIYTPRLLVMVLGVGAVLATALLGAELGRRAAGRADPARVRAAGWVGALVGGGLLATSAVHVLSSSHLAWPHSTVLLYLTLAFWLLERAVGARGAPTPVAGDAPAPPPPPPAAGEGERRNPHPSPLPEGEGVCLPLSRARGAPGWPEGRGNPRPGAHSGGPALVGAGLAFGLAQQQHPTILLLWPVFLGYVIWRGRAYFRTRWAYAAVGAFLVGISPLIAYNLVVTDFGTLKESRQQTSDYQEGRDKDFSYRGRAVEIALTVTRLPGSAIDARPAAASYLLDPLVVGYAVLAVAGLVAAARLGAWSLPLATVVFLVLLPLFPASHDNLPRQGRYLMPVLPLAFAGVGGLAALLWPRAVQALRGGRVLLAAVLAAVVLYPLVPLIQYELRVLAANETNDRYFVTLGALERQRRPDEPVVLDPTLQRDRPGAAGTAQRTFDFMTELRGIRGVVLEESSERIIRRIDTPTALVLADLEPSSLRHRNNADAWILEPLPNDEGGGFTLWRITRR